MRTITRVSEMLPVPTPPLPCNTPTPPPPDPSAAEFAQAIVNALNARNFDAVRASMDQSFVFAYWQSQGTSYPPDQAIEGLASNLSPTTPLVSDASKDLITLLDGLNPYALMGLDPAKSQALFVSGWGADGTSEAILYVTRRSNGSLYLYGVLIAPTRFVSTSNPVSHEAFCADTRIPALIEQLKGSVNQSNGDLFAGLVSPTHGVNVRLWAYSSEVNFSPTSAKNCLYQHKFIQLGRRTKRHTGCRFVQRHHPAETAGGVERAEQGNLLR